MIPGDDDEIVVVAEFSWKSVALEKVIAILCDPTNRIECFLFPLSSEHSESLKRRTQRNSPLISVARGQKENRRSLLLFPVKVMFSLHVIDITLPDDVVAEVLWGRYPSLLMW